MGATIDEIKGVVTVVGKTYRTPLVTIPGIGAGSAYAAADAFGTKFNFDVPKSGVIHSALFLDKDNEGKDTDLVLFNADFNATADNAAFTVSDIDFQACIGTITFSTWKAFAVNQMGTATAVGLAYIAPDRKIYCQAVARGAPNIAAGAEPMVALVILADE